MHDDSMTIIVHPAFTSRALQKLAARYAVPPGHVARPILALAATNARGRVASGVASSAERELSKLRCMALQRRRYEILAAFSYSAGWTLLDVENCDGERMLVVARGKTHRFVGAAEIEARLLEAGKAPNGRQVWISIFETVITR